MEGEAGPVSSVVREKGEMNVDAYLAFACCLCVWSWILSHVIVPSTLKVVFSPCKQTSQNYLDRHTQMYALTHSFDLTQSNQVYNQSDLLQNPRLYNSLGVLTEFPQIC